MNYNPYDLVQLLINGKPITGRPYEFDSNVVNQKKMTNAFGTIVKPTKVATVCPDCAQGLLLDIKLGEPPFAPYSVSCQYCRPGPPPLSDPFVNPVKTGRVTHQELNPLLADPVKPLPQTQGSVADRFRLAPLGPPEPQTAAQVPQAAPAPVRAAKPKKNKKKAPPAAPVQTQIDGLVVTRTTDDRPTVIEGADGLTEEVDFDDREMVDE